MDEFDWPDDLQPQAAQWLLQTAVQQMRSPHNGTLQTQDLMAERWQISLDLPPRQLASGGAVEALLFRLSGGRAVVRCWHFARPVPRGTLRGSPVLAAAAVRGAGYPGAAPISIQTTAGATLLAGDMLGVALADGSTQLIQAAADALANGSGLMALTTTTHLRGPANVGAAVQWSRPRARFVLPGSRNGVAYRPAMQGGASFDLDEAF